MDNVAKRKEPMPPRRSILLHGLRLVARVPGVLLWTYAANLGIALVFSLRLHAQLSSVLDHSLAAERLNSAFDLGTLNAALHRLNYQAPDTGASSYAGLPLYLLCYFVFVPGALFCYQASCPSRLPIFFSSGISFFWRFIRITILTAIASLVILTPLFLFQNAWSEHVDNHLVGSAATLHKLPGIVLILLVAALLRLYFDLVEVYTIQLGDRYLPDGKADRRVRRTLLPALRTLRQNFGRAYFAFLFLTLLGFASVFVTGRIVMHMLAQPRVWPGFLLAQAGLFGMMATRFWQRGAESILVCDNPLPKQFAQQIPACRVEPICYVAPQHLAADAQSDPEPAAPSLEGPDPGVFHHEPGTRDQGLGTRD
jgi:hypothetical protein